MFSFLCILFTYDFINVSFYTNEIYIMKTQQIFLENIYTTLLIIMCCKITDGYKTEIIRRGDYTKYLFLFSWKIEGVLVKI